MSAPITPTSLRDGVRQGVLTALASDFELIGARTAGYLIAAGVAGVAGAVGVTSLVSGHEFGHHPPWHVLIFSTIWAGLLIVSLSLVFLRIRTPTLQLSRAAAVGLVGLGLVGLCGAACPDPHFLKWWTTTAPGAWALGFGGIATTSLCFGFLSSIAAGLAAALLVLRGSWRGRQEWMLPALALFLMIEPAVILQSVGTSLSAFAAWTIGTAVGCYAGVVSALALRSLGARQKDVTVDAMQDGEVAR